MIIDTLNTIASTITGETINGVMLTDPLNAIASKGQATATNADSIDKALQAVNDNLENIISGGGGSSETITIYEAMSNSDDEPETDINDAYKVITLYTDATATAQKPLSEFQVNDNIYGFIFSTSVFYYSGVLPETVGLSESRAANHSYIVADITDGKIHIENAETQEDYYIDTTTAGTDTTFKYILSQWRYS